MLESIICIILAPFAILSIMFMFSLAFGFLNWGVTNGNKHKTEKGN